MLTHVVAAFLASDGTRETAFSFTNADTNGPMLGEDTKSLATRGPGDGGAGRRLMSSCEDSLDFASLYLYGFPFVAYGDETCENVLSALQKYAQPGGRSWEVTCGYPLTLFDAALAEYPLPVTQPLVERYPNFTWIYEVCPWTCATYADFELPCDGHTAASPPSLADLGFTEVVGDGSTYVCSSCNKVIYNASEPENIPIDKDVVSTLGRGGCCAMRYPYYGYAEGVYGSTPPSKVVYEDAWSRVDRASTPRTIDYGEYTYTKHSGDASGFTWDSIGTGWNSLGYTGGVQSTAECAQLCLNTNGCSGIEISANFTVGSCTLLYHGACNDVSAAWFYHVGTGRNEGGELLDVCQTYRLDSPVVLTCPDTCTDSPSETCFYDPTCSDTGGGWGGGLGCNAGGKGQPCRFCGFTAEGNDEPYVDCPVTSCPDVCTGNPSETCFFDPTCSDPGAGWGGGLGCNAGGQGQDCRFCGFGPFTTCPTACELDDSSCECFVERDPNFCSACADDCGSCDSFCAAPACDLNAMAGAHTCGARISWLQTAQGLTETTARDVVAAEFPAECGACGVTPTPSPTPTCDAEADAGGYTCKARIEWLIEVKGLSAAAAGAKVEDEFPEECAHCTYWYLSYTAALFVGGAATLLGAAGLVRKRYPKNKPRLTLRRAPPSSQPGTVVGAAVPEAPVLCEL